MYMLDNEPTLWNSTHRDLHPAQVTYEELLQLTLESSAAIRVADPGARIAGFTGWGYSSIFDTGDGRGAAPTERARQVDTALLPWWLAKLKEHDRKTGKRSVDYVDMHFYPQGANIGMGANGGTDTETAMRRIRSVRALWDPSYKDESWINDAQQLIPRLRRLIAQGYPGLGIVIGEYNFGGEKHISGALALAETLGRFGVLGVDGAFYLSWPEKGSLAAWAFKAFRNYDGKGAAFGNESIEVAADPDPLASVFASRAPDGKLVLIALNSDPERGLELKIDGKLCGSPSPGRNFTLSGADGLQPDPAVRDGGRYRLRPWSISVIELNPPAKK